MDMGSGPHSLPMVAHWVQGVWRRTTQRLYMDHHADHHKRHCDQEKSKNVWLSYSSKKHPFGHMGKLA